MGAQGQPNLVGFAIPFILMIAFLYFVVYLPENKRKKKYKGMLDTLKLNDEIITRGGILGRIVNIKDNYIVLETGPNRIRIKLDKNGILSVVNSSEELSVKKEENDEVVEATKEN